MQYLVEMKLAAYGRPTGGPQDGISFIEQYIPLTSFSGRMVALLPRLERLKARLQNGPSAAV